MSVRLALIQRAVESSREAAREGASDAVRAAADEGANIVCLPELHDLPYFPRTVSVGNTALAEPQPSPASDELGRLAGRLGVVLVVPVFERAAPGVAFNTALIYDADGSLLGRYRKNHLPDGPGYHEKYYFTPGNGGYPVWDTAFGRLGVGICWDQWFPETARSFALGGAQLLLFPTAIGSEPDRPGYSSEEVWRTVMRGHAVANGLFVGAANRVGTEAEMTWYGGSFVADPFGEVLASGGAGPDLVVADLDFDRIGELRDLFQFFRDRRVDSYRGLLEVAPAAPGDPPSSGAP